MEKDPEMKGDGNSYTTEFRQYDPRLGRWMSLDPLAAQFPGQSPYCAFDNNPIFYTDPYGLAAGPGDPPGAPESPGTELGQVSPGTDGRSWYWNGSLWTTAFGDGTVKPQNSEIISVDNPGPTPMEAALMAARSYIKDLHLKTGDQKDLEGGWRVSDKIPEGVDMENEDIGFQSVLFERMYQGKMQYAYVMRGTDEKIDWDNNLLQAFGTAAQYNLAIDNARVIVKVLGVENVTLIGHSLGGGVATAAALIW